MSVEIGSLWIGNRLSWIEQLCLKSFVDFGHNVTVFTESMNLNVPSGVKVRNIREIWDFDPMLLQQTGAALIADIFRMHLMKQTDMTWIDTDAICLENFTVDNKVGIFGKNHGDVEIANGILRLPSDCKIADWVIEKFEDPEFICPWIRPALRQRAAKLPPAKRLGAMFQMKRTIYGPRALTYAARQEGIFAEAVGADVLYPVPWWFVSSFFNPHGGIDGWITKETMSVHLYTSQIAKKFKGEEPHPDSYVGKLFAQQGGSIS